MSGRESGSAPEGFLARRTAAWLYGAVVLGVLAVLLYVLRSVLTPFVLYLVFLYLVWPLAGTRVHVRLVAVTSALLVLWVFHTTGLLLAPFVLGFILAYILNPVVERLEEVRIPRPAGIGLLTLPLLGLLAVGVFVLAPAVGGQVSEFISNVPGYVESVEGWVAGLREWAIGLGIAGINERTVPELREIDAQVVVGALRRWRAELTATGMQAVLGVGRGLGAVLTGLGYLVLTPVLTYFLLRDWPQLRGRLVDLVPDQHRERVVGFASVYDQLLGRYMRGQLLLALVVGALVGLGFWIVGFPYALLIGLVAGIFNLVPYLGLVVSAAAAVIVALFSGAVVTSLLKVAGVYAVEQVVEQVVGPRIVGESVGLHPVWVILALVLFGFFFGFVGLLIAVPAAAGVKLVVAGALRRYRASAFYTASG